MVTKTVVTALIVSCLVSTPAGPAAAQSLDELYRLAKAEGRVNLYGGGPAAIYTGWAKVFEEKFPGIKVQVTGDFSNRLTGRIDAQRKAGTMEADLAILQTIQDFVRWKKEGALVQWKPEGFEKIPSAFKDDDGTYVGIGVNGLVYAYNPKLVDTGDVPRSAKDFLNPRFAGKIVSTYPHDDDITLYLYHTIVERHGWQFMDGLMKNTPAYVMGHLGVAQKIAAGEFALTFDSTVSSTMGAKRRGGSIELAIPDDDPVPIWAQTAAIFKGAPHPNAARLYLAWYLSKEQQQRMHRVGSWSPRNDVEPPAGFKPIDQYRLARGFREFITDGAKVAELRKKFEGYIGPVKGEAYR